MKARLVLAAAALFATVLSAPGQTAEQWITRARARLGSEAALQGVTSIRYLGTLDTDGANQRKLDIIFQKPLQQLITQLVEQGTHTLTDMQDKLSSVIVDKAMNVVSAISALAFNPSGAEAVASAGH